MYDCVIWDFNGTILDDVAIGIESVNALLARRLMPLLADAAEYRRKFCFPIIEYYKRVGFDFDKESFSDVAHEWVREYDARLCEAELRADVLDVIRNLNGKVPQMIISASEEDKLISQLNMFGIFEYFDEVCGCRDIYAHGKRDIAVKWARSNKKRALMIGDTVHDFETAAAAGFGCLLITGGHSDFETLSNCGCPVICNPSDIIRILEEENGI